jgi:flagellar basal body-associated protein FliL
MKTWIIVTIAVVIFIIAVVIYMSLKPSKTQTDTQATVVSTAPTNFYDFASGALPQLIDAFKKDKPSEGMGATPVV